MLDFVKKALMHFWAFICDQYLVLFFILTISVKLIFFSTYVIKVTWAKDQYYQGIFFSFLTAALIFSALFFVKKYKNRLSIILAFVISSILLMDTIYFSYFQSLPTTGILSSIGQVKDVGPAVGEIFRWQLLLYMIDIIPVVIFYKSISSFFRRKKDKHGLKKSNKIASFVVVVTILIFLVNQLFVIGINRLPDVFNEGFDTITTAQLYGVLGAHTIDIARFVQQGITHLSPEQEKVVTDWVKNNKPIQINSNLNGVASGKNVIILQIESLGGFVINQKINDKEITPNLNILAKNSQFFPNDRFILGAGHTSDTDFVSNTSYFPLPDASVFVRYGEDNFTSLPKTLIANGYSASAYHGYNRNFWNRNAALASIGYQKFYAADNYPAGAKINMGLNDGDFLLATADYIKDQPKPSLSYAITLSSHVPFEITDQTKELGINPKNFPQQVGGYLENINYTDRMIGKFFEKLKSYGLYDNSLIVVFGDHTPVLPTFSAGTINYNPKTVQEKEVPLFVKLPISANIENKTYPDKGSHLDITPTIFDLLGIKTNQLMFGQSLFVENSQSTKTCDDQLDTFLINKECKTAINEEKSKADTIIRYNLFDLLQK